MHLSSVGDGLTCLGEGAALPASNNLTCYGTFLGRQAGRHWALLTYHHDLFRDFPIIIISLLLLTHTSCHIYFGGKIIKQALAEKETGRLMKAHPSKGTFAPLGGRKRQLHHTHLWEGMPGHAFWDGGQHESRDWTPLH